MQLVCLSREDHHLQNTLLNYIFKLLFKVTAEWLASDSRAVSPASSQFLGEALGGPQASLCGWGYSHGTNASNLDSSSDPVALQPFDGNRSYLQRFCGVAHNIEPRGLRHSGCSKDPLSVRQGRPSAWQGQLWVSAWQGRPSTWQGQLQGG